MASEPNLKTVSFGSKDAEHELSEWEAISRENGRTDVDESRESSLTELEKAGPELRHMMLEEQVRDSQREMADLQADIQSLTTTWQSDQKGSLEHESTSEPKPSPKAGAHPTIHKLQQSSSFSINKGRAAPIRKKGKSYDNIRDFIDDDADNTRYPLPLAKRNTPASPLSSNGAAAPDSSRTKGKSKTVEEPEGGSAKSKKKEDRSRSKGKGKPSQKQLAHQKAQGSLELFRQPSDTSSVSSSSVVARRSPWYSGTVVEVALEEQERRLERLKQIMAEARQKGALGRKAPAVKGDRMAFSSEEFWVELRARVLRKSVEDERLAVDARRRRVQLVIEEVEAFRFSAPDPAAAGQLPASPGGRRQGGLELAMQVVRGMLGRVEEVLEGSFPCVYKRHPRSLSNRFPDIARAPFATRLEALQKWQGAAEGGKRAVEELRRAALQGSWDSPDLGGLLHRVSMGDVTALLLAKARAALHAMRTLHYPSAAPLARRRAAVAVRRSSQVGSKVGGLAGAAAGSVQQRKQAVQNELKAREYLRLLGPEEMALPWLVGAHSLAAELAAQPLEILKRVVSWRVRRFPRRLDAARARASRHMDASVVQQRFAECVELLRSARDFAEELREFLQEEGRSSAAEYGQEGDLRGIRGWVGAAELEEGLVQVLLLLFDLARGSHLPPDLAGARGAKELQEAAEALSSQEAPQIIALLPIFSKVDVAVQAAQRHCTLLEGLLRSGTRLLEGLDRAGASEEEEESAAVVEACKAAVGVAREACGAMGVCVEVEVATEGDAATVLQALKRARYTWLKGAGGELSGADGASCTVLLGSASLTPPSTDGRGAPHMKAAMQKCKAVLSSTYGDSLESRQQSATPESSKRAESGDLPTTDGHVLALCLSRTLPGHDSIESLWEAAQEGSGPGASMVVEGLEELMEGVAAVLPGRGVLVASKAEAVQEELQAVQEQLEGREVTVEARGEQRPLRVAVGEGVAAVRRALCELEEAAEGQMLRCSAACAREQHASEPARGDGGGDQESSTAGGSRCSEEEEAEEEGAAGRLWQRLGHAQRAMDLIACTALPRGVEVVSGRYRLAVARRWVEIRREAMQRMQAEGHDYPGGWGGGGGRRHKHSSGAEAAAAAGVGRLSAERLRYLEGAVRASLAEMSEDEWKFWRQYLEEAWSGGAGTQTGKPRTMLLARLCCAEVFRARVVRKRGGEVEQRRAKVEELERELQEKSLQMRNAGRVQEERQHQQRMVVTNDVGTQLVWIMGKRLGEGSFGKVFRAQFWHSLEFVAVKMVDATKEDKETQLMRKLWHPNIVRFYGKETDGFSVYILMEYCAQGDLRELVMSWRESKMPNQAAARRQEASGLEREASGVALGREMSGVNEREGSNEFWMKGRYPIVSVDIVRQYARQLADGLGHMHDQLIVHRDLKAPNILVAGDGKKVKITDLGCAVEKQPGGAWGDVMKGSAGTPGHQAPEVLDRVRDGKRSRGELGPKVDVWSLGCVVAEMLTGELPELMVWRSGFIPDHPQARFYRLHKMAPELLVLPYRDHLALEALPEAVAFLDACFAVHPDARAGAYQLVQHAFLDLRR